MIFTLSPSSSLIFNADVEAQGGAYATGVLVLITSGAVAVTLAQWGERHCLSPLRDDQPLFGYTTVTNVIERPDGCRLRRVHRHDRR